MKILTKEFLDNAICEDPDCDHQCETNKLYFHSLCHPEVCLTVYYDKEISSIVMECAVCSLPVATIGVHH